MANRQAKPGHRGADFVETSPGTLGGRVTSDSRHHADAAQEEWGGVDTGQDALDIALTLANHAQRLQRIETVLGHMERALIVTQETHSHTQTRQNILIGVFTGLVVLGGLGWAVSPFFAPANFSKVAPPAQLALQQQPAQLALQQPSVQLASQTVPAGVATLKSEAALPITAAIAPPITPAASPKRVDTLQYRVLGHLKGAALPSGWQAFFDRDATGDTKATLQIAAKFLTGEGVTADQAFAVALITQAGNAGDKEAMLWLGDAYANNAVAGVTRHVAQKLAVEWLEKAANAGVVSASTALGKFYESGLDTPEPQTARAWYRRAAQAGDATAVSALTRLNAEPATAPPTLADVKQVQQLLNAQGYAVTTNGDWGAATQAIIKRYQHDHQLYPDGKISPSLVASLQQGGRQH